MAWKLIHTSNIQDEQVLCLYLGVYMYGYSYGYAMTVNEKRGHKLERE